MSKAVAYNVALKNKRYVGTWAVPGYWTRWYNNTQYFFGELNHQGRTDLDNILRATNYNYFPIALHSDKFPLYVVLEDLRLEVTTRSLKNISAELSGTTANSAYKPDANLPTTIYHGGHLNYVISGLKLKNASALKLRVNKLKGPHGLDSTLVDITTTPSLTKPYTKTNPAIVSLNKSVGLEIHWWDPQKTYDNNPVLKSQPVFTTHVLLEVRLPNTPDSAPALAYISLPVTLTAPEGKVKTTIVDASPPKIKNTALERSMATFQLVPGDWSGAKGATEAHIVVDEMFFNAKGATGGPAIFKKGTDIKGHCKWRNKNAAKLQDCGVGTQGYLRPPNAETTEFVIEPYGLSPGRWRVNFKKCLVSRLTKNWYQYCERIPQSVEFYIEDQAKPIKITKISPNPVHRPATGTKTVTLIVDGENLVNSTTRKVDVKIDGGANKTISGSPKKVLIPTSVPNTLSCGAHKITLTHDGKSASGTFNVQNNHVELGGNGCQATKLSNCKWKFRVPNTAKYHIFIQYSAKNGTQAGKVGGIWTLKGKRSDWNVSTVTGASKLRRLSNPRGTTALPHRFTKGTDYTVHLGKRTGKDFPQTIAKLILSEDATVARAVCK